MRDQLLSNRARVFVFVLACALAMTSAMVASGTEAATTSAEHPDYQGTYAGIATTDGGAKVPFTAFVRDDGDEMEITARAKGYTVRLTAPENWTGRDTLDQDLKVPGLFKTIIDGSAKATFKYSGNKWTVVGNGSGTVLVVNDGSATAQGEMVTRGFDQAKADAWIKAHVKAQKATKSVRMPQVEKAAAALAPSKAQPPLPDPQKLATLALLLVLFVIMLICALVFGWTEPQFDRVVDAISKRMDAVDVSKPPAGTTPSEGGDA